MSMKVYMCKYCGQKKYISGPNIPLRTRCFRRPGGGLHTWVLVKTVG